MSGILMILLSKDSELFVCVLVYMYVVTRLQIYV